MMKEYRLVNSDRNVWQCSIVDYNPGFIPGCRFHDDDEMTMMMMIKS